MDGTGTYAPQSPDLSQFLGSGPAKAAADTTAFHPRNAQSNNQSQQQFYCYPPIPPLPTTHHQFGASEAYHVPTYSAAPPPHHHQPKYPTPTAYLQHSPPPPRSEDINRLSAAASSAQQAMAQQAASSSSGGNDLGPSLGIEIRTKFPVARIKRIMQADEEVGKVAQVTPVAVSKALELFMISLCTKSASIARAGSSKRITAAHLKAAIEADDQFDFLNEITSKVAGPQESEAATGEKKGRSSRATKAQETKSEGDSEENVEKKVKTTRGRKKKSDAE